MSYAAPAGSSGLRNDGLKQRAGVARSTTRPRTRRRSASSTSCSRSPTAAGSSAPAARAPPRAKVAVPVAHSYLEATKGGSAMKAIPVLQLDPRVLEHLDQSGVPAERGGPAEDECSPPLRAAVDARAAAQRRARRARGEPRRRGERRLGRGHRRRAGGGAALGRSTVAAPFPPSPLNAPVFDCGHGCGPTVDGSPPWRGPGADPAAGGAPDGSLASTLRDVHVRPRSGSGSRCRSAAARRRERRRRRCARTREAERGLQAQAQTAPLRGETWASESCALGLDAFLLGVNVDVYRCRHHRGGLRGAP